MGFYVSPDDLAKYVPLFGKLSTWWQLVIVAALILMVSAFVTWRFARLVYGERFERQRVIIEDYREKLKGLSPIEASQEIQRLEATITRMQWRTITSEHRALFR